MNDRKNTVVKATLVGNEMLSEGILDKPKELSRWSA